MASMSKRQIRRNAVMAQDVTLRAVAGAKPALRIREGDTSASRGLSTKNRKGDTKYAKIAKAGLGSGNVLKSQTFGSQDHRGSRSKAKLPCLEHGVPGARPGCPIPLHEVKA